MRRWGRGLGAIAALLGLLVGVPAALVVLGEPLPRRWDTQGLLDALLRPDDGTILVHLLTLVGWAAWLVFALSVAAELVNLAVPARRFTLPGLAGVQRWAAGLMLSSLTVLAAGHLAPGSPPLPATPARLAPVDPGAADRGPPMRVEARAQAVDPAPARAEAVAPEPAHPPTAGANGADPRTHVVRRGDDLWSLAERYYGRGRDWRRIATANPDLLTGGPDRLEIGWRLAIPGPHPGAEETVGRVRVRDGDTLTALAERELGDGHRWPEIFAANADQLTDPDELPAGITLRLPVHAGSSVPARKQEPPKPAESGAERSGRGAETRPMAPPAAGPQAPTAPAAPSPEASSTTRPEAPPATPEPVEGQDELVDLPAALGLAAVGGLLAAGLVGSLAVRRRVQLQLRPVGSRIPPPPPAARPAEVVIGRRARPLSLRTLDRATRAIAAHCRRSGVPLPSLQVAYLGEDQLELVLSEVAPDAPVCFTVSGRSWLLSRADAPYLGTVPGLSDAPRPWPTLVALGTDDRQRQVLVDLETLGLLGLDGPPELTAGVLAAMAVELSCSPWAEELRLTLVGDDHRWPDALGQHNVTRCDDAGVVLDRLQRRADDQRAHAPAAVLGQRRLDAEVAEAWVPEVVLVGRPLDPGQLRRLTDLVTGEPRVTLAAVVTGPTSAAVALELSGPGRARLRPAGTPLAPQTLPPPALDAVVALVAATGSTSTEAAPWWHPEEKPPERPPDNVAYLGDRFDDEDEGRAAVRARMVDLDPGEVRLPTLRLLGPVDLLGAAGPPPPRASRQCLEYCAWLLEQPGTTAQAMAAALVVAEGTRRSNMSRLRSWLGADPDGQPYLPDAYTGRIRLHPDVSSDWQQLQLLTVGGVNRTSTASLELALELVRGAPLADAAPGQWCWAEELRTDMISCVRDVGVELAGRAIGRGDVDLARWAAARALAAAPGDELLLSARVRTEHLAGNGAETERLSRQFAAQAQVLGVDLDPATVALLQQVMEGRVRARMV